MRPRKNFSKEIQWILRDWLAVHQENPYPNEFEKASLCQQTGLSKKQLRIWFTNGRKVSLIILVTSSRSSFHCLNGKGSNIKIWYSEPNQTNKTPSCVSCTDFSNAFSLWSILFMRSVVACTSIFILRDDSSDSGLSLCKQLQERIKLTSRVTLF